MTAPWPARDDRRRAWRCMAGAVTVLAAATGTGDTAVTPGGTAAR